MEHRHDEGRILVRLDRGEEVLTALRALAREHDVGTASLAGIGAVRDAEIAYYDLGALAYETRTFAEVAELLSLSGNVALVDGEPFIHAHAVLGRRDMSTVGGHLVRATVAVTVEAFLDCFESRVDRELDPEVKLKLLKL